MSENNPVATCKQQKINVTSANNNKSEVLIGTREPLQRSNFLTFRYPGVPYSSRILNKNPTFWYVTVESRLTQNFRRKTFSFINEKVAGKLVLILTVNSVGYSQQKLKKVAMNILDGLNLSKINGHEIEQSLLLQLNNQHLLSCIFLYFIRLELCIFHCIIFCQAIQPMRSSGYESAGSKPIAGLDKQLCTSLLLKSTPFNPLNKVISKSITHSQL